MFIFLFIITNANKETKGFCFASEFATAFSNPHLLSPCNMIQTRSYSNNYVQSLNLPYPIKAVLARELWGRHLSFSCHHLHTKTISKGIEVKEWVLQLKQKDKIYIKSQLMAKQHTLCWSPSRNIYQKLRVKSYPTNCFVKSVFIRVLNCENLKIRRTCRASLSVG